jgi:hypothetical protein
MYEKSSKKIFRIKEWYKGACAILNKVVGPTNAQF